jgi:hypothetical protein
MRTSAAGVEAGRQAKRPSGQETPQKDIAAWHRMFTGTAGFLQRQ